MDRILNDVLNCLTQEILLKKMLRMRNLPKDARRLDRAYSRKTGEVPKRLGHIRSSKTVETAKAKGDLVDRPAN